MGTVLNEVWAGIEPTIRVLQTRALTIWPPDLIINFKFLILNFEINSKFSRHLFIYGRLDPAYCGDNF